jgi:hypothetical protein
MVYSQEEKTRLKKELVDTLKETRGNVLAACSRVGLPRRTFYNWKNEDSKWSKNIGEILEEERENMVDFAEGKLFELIGSGDKTAIIFYLKTMGERYHPRQAVELSGTLETNNKLSEEDKKDIIERFKNAGIKVTEESL